MVAFFVEKDIEVRGEVFHITNDETMGDTYRVMKVVMKSKHPFQNLEQIDSYNLLEGAHSFLDELREKGEVKIRGFGPDYWSPKQKRKLYVSGEKSYLEDWKPEKTSVS